MKKIQRPRRVMGLRNNVLMLAILSAVGLPRARGNDNHEDPALGKWVQRIVAACVDKIEGDDELKHWTKTIHIDPFVDTDGKTSYGVSDQIASEFKQRGFEIKPQASFKMQGTIAAKGAKELPDDDFQSAAIEVACEFQNEDGDCLWKIDPVKIFARDAIQQLGPNIAVEPDLSLEDQSTLLLKQLENPEPKIQDDTILVAHEGSPFGLEVVVAGNQLPIQLDSNSQSPTVLLDSGQEYRVRLHNSESFPVGVRLLIDGVSMFVMATDLSVNSMIVVPPGKSIEVSGWWIRAEGEGGMTAFKAGDAAESVAARLGQPHVKMGTISAAFHAMWPKDGQPPQDESFGVRGILGTQQGAEFTTDNPVIKDHAFGVCRAIVSVNYDANPN